MQKLLTKRKRKLTEGQEKSSKVVSVLFQSNWPNCDEPGVTVQVKLKLTDDFDNFLGLMLAAYWQLDMRYIYT